MLKRDWLFILAFGIVFETRAFAQQLPDQPIEQQTEGDRQQQGQESAALPGFPVRILEEPEQSESAKREQGEAAQREIDDLVAQQLAAKAADRSYKVGIAQTILAFFGTGALIYSLHLNRRATKAAETGVLAARRAIEQEQANAQRQMRAYITYSSLVVTSRPYSSDANSLIAGYDFSFQLKNSGITPAHQVLTAIGVGIAPKGGLNSRATIPACQFIENDSHGYFGPGEESGVDAVFIKAEDFIQADAGGQVITIAVQVKYFDAFECHRTYKACLGITFTVDPAMLRQKPITEGRLFSSIVIGPDNGGD